MRTIMNAVIKRTNCSTSIVLALFGYRADAENYIKERMIESIPSHSLVFGKSGTLEIENEFYIEPLEVEIGGKDND